MEKKSKKLPKFKNIREEAEFWDTHSFADYWDQFDDVDLVIQLQKPKDETVVVRIQKDMKEKMQQVAKTKGINVSTLARIWLLEKLSASPKG